MDNIITLEENNKKLAKLWLWQSVGALALSGFFAIFLVIARSPHIGKLLPYKDFFKTSLTIHVNLSVLIWLTSIICTIFACRTKFLRAGYAGFFACFAGTLIIAGSIFDTSATAFLNNYVPMLDSKIFTLGIGIYLCGLMIAALQGYEQNTNNKVLKYFCVSSFFIILISMVVLGLTYSGLQLPENKDLYNFADRYERLFWGFGHSIQFLYVNAFIFVVFAVIFKNTKKSHVYLMNLCFCLNLLFAASSIYIITGFDVSSFEYIDMFTKQMVHFGGLASIVAAFIILPQIVRTYKISDNKPQRNAVMWAVILFTAGGIISFFIEGVNTIIPAHYHGSIVGVSLGLMAFTYMLMPKLGYEEVRGKMANLQAGLYGLGQLIHIIGFALSGGYGAMRKTPGTELATEAKLYMGLMGLGGLISIIGGLFFVIVIFRAIRKSKSK